MSGSRKLTPIEAFELNMADAHQLVKLVEGFTNQRTRRMRAELRERVGDALKIPDRRQAELLPGEQRRLRHLPPWRKADTCRLR